MNYDVVLNANDNTALETQYAFTQGDYGQIQFSIRVKADGQYVTDALRAYIVFTLSNGMIVTGADMPKSMATYTYVFQGNELQSPGKVVADVKLVYANGQISSNKFMFICRYDPLADKTVPAGAYITDLQKIVSDGQEKLDYLQALIDSLEQGIGETPVTRADLQNDRSITSPGVKAIDAAMAQYILLTSDMTNQIINDNNKVASASSVHGLQQSTNTSIDNLNSNLALKANADDLGFNQTEHRIGNYKGKALYAKTVFVTKSVNATWQTVYTVSGATLVLIDYGKSYVVDGSLVMLLESKDGSGVISRCTGASVQCYCFLDKTYEFALSVMYTKD